MLRFVNKNNYFYSSCKFPASVIDVQRNEPVQRSNVERHVDVQAGSWLDVQTVDQVWTSNRINHGPTDRIKA